MFHYVKHAFMAVAYPITAVIFIMWPHWSFLVAVGMMVIYLWGDLGTPPDISTPNFRRPWILDSYLYIHLVGSVMCLGALMWIASPGDLGGVGAWLHRTLGVGATDPSDHGWIAVFSSAYSMGFLLSTNTIVAHELVHRTSDRFAMFAGRWMIALVGDAQFSMSHVYGHHANVATRSDPASARRGENLYFFIVRSTLGQYRDALDLESRRLRGRPPLVRFFANRVVTGTLMTSAVVAVFYTFAGLRGLLAYGILVVISKMLFEAVNYIEHYGLVRVPNTPVHPRHSWDCSSRAASNILLNITRHANHHADGRVQYYALKPIEGSLDLPYGYFGHMLLAMFPPLWHRFAAPRLEFWDRTMATPAERELAREANRLSGVRLFAEMHVAPATGR